jgi:oligopeptide transport system ATP-binding protein
MTLLSVEGLTVHFRIRRGVSKKSVQVVHAADDVSFTIDRGETLALVGESGSGKTTVAEAILQLNKPTAGRICFEDRCISDLKGSERRAVQRRVQIVFQDPFSSLDPRMTVHDLVAEPLKANARMSGKDLEARVVSLLEMVGLGTQHLWRRPHEFSGGQCQRIAIARSLALEPDLIVLDEPTSALDVSVQARILVLLQQLQKELGLAYLMVAHDLAVVESVADKVAVMYLGRIVEEGPADELFLRPRHPYTAALLASVPSPDPDQRGALGVLQGDVPSAVEPPPGCRFHTRCAYRMDVCSREVPEMRESPGGTRRACHLPPATLPTPKSIETRDETFEPMSTAAAAPAYGAGADTAAAVQRGERLDPEDGASRETDPFR